MIFYLVEIIDIQIKKIIMKNQRLRNPSIVIPTESRVKSFTDFDDKSVMMNDGQIQNSEQLFNESIHIQKWMICKQKTGKRYQSEADNDVTKNSNCYMIQIDDIFEIGYRRKISALAKQRERLKEKQREKDIKNNSKANDGYVGYAKKEAENQSKVYVKIYANLVNLAKMSYISRTIQFNVVELQSIKQTSFKTSEPNLAIFFHSRYSPQNQIKVRVELAVLQSSLADNQQVVQNQEYLGYLDIDPFKGLKTKQKGQIYSQRLAANLDTSINYTVLVSDSFKVLEKLIPPNCLCSSDETIAGLAGRRLPNNMMGLHYNIQYTQLHSLRIDIVCADVPDSLINTKMKQCEKLAMHLQNIQNPVAVLKEVKLQSMFHNGWTSFSESSIRLQDKMQIQRKQMKKSSKHQVVKQIIKLRQFTTNQLCNLPFVFLDQQAILIMQLVGKVQIKNQQSIQSIFIPLCYAYYVIDKISVDEKQVKQLFIGDGLNDINFGTSPRKHQFHGKIQFYVQMEHANKMKLSKHLITIHTNKSNTEFDRIILEKERMIRENKKLRNMNRVKKIELNQEIPILDTTNFKQNLYKDDIERIRQERKEKEELLQYLKKKVKQLCPSSDESELRDEDINNYLQSRKNFMDRSSAENFHNSVFYKAALEKSLNEHFLAVYNQDAIRVRPFSIFQQTGIANLYQSGQIPLDIIKTELLEQNYCYAIFINWISLNPISYEKKLPRRFKFQTSFFKNSMIRSCICAINQSTGEIEVVDEDEDGKVNEHKENHANINKDKDKGQQVTNRQKTMEEQKQERQGRQNKSKTRKIFYIEVGPDMRSKNSQSNFIEFIGYLYHSEIQIKLIDAISGIEFGECYFKLKDLIRMRRNQVSVGKELWVKRSGEPKAKLKMQIKAMRKQATLREKQKAQVTSQLQTLSMPQEARQLHRIALYKRNKLGDESSLNKVDKVLNEELTKEEMFLNVSRMKMELITVEVVNRKNHAQSYRITINDPDKPFLVNDELVVMNRALLSKIGQTRWWRYLNTIEPNKYSHILVPDDRNCFELNPGQTGAILLYYYSERKYEGDYHRESNNKIYEAAPTINNPALTVSPVDVHQSSTLQKTQLLKVYNHNRCIDLTLTNNSNNVLQSMYRININPEPDYPTLVYKFVRKSNSKLLVEVPYVPSYDYVVYIDDPTVVSTLNQRQGFVALDCFSGGEGQCRMFNVSILSPFPENRLLLNYHFQMWGAYQIYIECGLWKSQEVLIDLHSSVCQRKGLDYILALSQDEKAVTVRQKNPIKVNQKQAKTIIRANVLSSIIGISHYELNIVSPTDYSIVYRYTLKVETEEPDICQKLTLRIRLTDKFLEEMFGFRNQLIKKQRFKLLTTHPHILSPQLESIQVEAKAQKKIKIKINAQEMSETTNVILTMLADTISFNYLFVLQLDTQLL